jgi:quinol monooxygenase YgiN
MYGTIARMRLKPGQEGAMQETMREYETLNVPGYVSSTVYKMDEDSNEFYMAVVFEDQASYRANAESPEQNARYEKMMEMLDGEPEWHDGEIVYSR